MLNTAPMAIGSYLRSWECEWAQSAKSGAVLIVADLQSLTDGRSKLPLAVALYVSRVCMNWFQVTAPSVQVATHAWSDET